MVKKCVGCVIAVLALISLRATPASANGIVDVKINVDCGCVYTVIINGGGVAPNADVAVTYQFDADNASAGSGTVHVTSDANGNFSKTVPGNPLTVGGCSGKILHFGIILGSWTIDGVSNGGFASAPPTPTPLDCTNPPPPPPGLVVTVQADCGCVYSVTMMGNTTPNASVTVGYSFDATVDGVTTPGAGSGTFTTNSDASGNFSLTVPGNVLHVACSGKLVTFGNITGTLSVNGSGMGTFPQGAPTPPVMDCTNPPPPPGKPLEIGPSSMEGHLQIRAGDFISGGYSFKFVSGGHGAEAVTVSSTLTVPFTCPQGGGPGGNIVINLGTHTYNVPAGNTDWQPTGDANSVLSWAGSGQAPDGCSGKIMDNAVGGVFDATISQNPDAGQLLNWRFKYRDPNAKGKGNVDCLNTSDPRRAKADVCGASWSQTVKDP
jgi:hypothetical protein